MAAPFRCLNAFRINILITKAVRGLPGSSGCRFSTNGASIDQEEEEQAESSSNRFEEQDHQIRQTILKASLPFVSSHGWTKKSLAAGAEVEGYPSTAHGMFPRGGVELIYYFHTTANQELVTKLKAEIEQLKAQGEIKPKTRPFIKNAIEERLKMITPYIDQWPQAMAIQALPQNALDSCKHLGHLMDDIWFYAGDDSVDFNWYTKRMSLGAVYQSAEIFLMQDRSDDHAETWSFLERRLDDLAMMGSTLKKFSQVGDVVEEGMTGMYIMGRNLLGLNSRNR